MDWLFSSIYDHHTVLEQYPIPHHAYAERIDCATTYALDSKKKR